MHVGRHTTAQSAEIHSFGVHLSTWLTVGKERARGVGTGLPTAVRKNQPLVPRSNLGGKVCARTDPWFRGQTLPVLGHGGGGGSCALCTHRACAVQVCTRTYPSWIVLPSTPNYDTYATFL